MTKIIIKEDYKNAPKKELIRDFNIAFAENNIEKILDFMADDIRWDLVGNKVAEGKMVVRKVLEEMGGEIAKELVLHTIVTHGDTAAANGEMHFSEMSVAFCDIYEFTGHDKNAKIKTLTSYGIELE